MTAFGILAVFSDPETLTEAARQMRQRGYSRMDAFSPFPVHGLAGILGMRKTRLQWLVLAGGVAGAAAAYGLVLYSVLIDYPINVGGRGLHSWPAFAVLAFEAVFSGPLSPRSSACWRRTGCPSTTTPPSMRRASLMPAAASSTFL